MIYVEIYPNQWANPDVDVLELALSGNQYETEADVERVLDSVNDSQGSAFVLDEPNILDDNTGRAVGSITVLS